MADPIYRLYSSEDLPSLLSLFLSAFGEPRDVCQWRWEYLDCRQESIIVIAEIEGKVVGHYAILSRPIRVGHSDMKAGLVVDVMTHSDFRRRGIFVQSAINAFRFAEEANLTFLIGFPNEAAIRGHREVGWTELGSIRLLVRPLRISGLLKTSERSIPIPSFLSRMIDKLLVAFSDYTSNSITDEHEISWVSAEEMFKLDSELEEFIHDTLKSFHIVNMRNIDWLKWRLSEPGCPHHIVIIRDKEKKMRGLAVLKIKTIRNIKTGTILDLLIPNGDGLVTKKILRELIRKAASEDCELCMMLKNPASRRTFPSLSVMMFPTQKKLRFIIRAIGDKRLSDSTLELHNWYLDLIDHDVF
jgi:hypothetical protein